MPDSLPNQEVPLDFQAGDPVDSPQNPAKPPNVSPVPIQKIDSDFNLTDAALMLGVLDSTTYIKIQKKWVGSTMPACNFFLITSLCEAGYCKKSKPFYKAADFDLYLLGAGFEKITLTEAKELLKTTQKFDLVFQKKSPNPGRSGHVMVGIGYDAATNKIRVAQGNYGVTTNEIKLVSDSFITKWQGGFNIFVRR